MAYDQKALGERIRAERKKNKLTIERLCELLEVSPSFIGLVERGTSGISLEKLCKLSEILHVSTDYLLKGEKEGAQPERSYAEILQANLCTYSEDELQFLVELMNFLRPRATLHGKK